MNLRVNLWEALTTLNRLEKRNPDAFVGPTVPDEMLRALGQSAHFHMTELEVEAIPGPVETGWRLRVFDQDAEGYSNIVEIFIPRDATEAVRVIKDQVGDRIYQHRRII